MLRRSLLAAALLAVFLGLSAAPASAAAPTSAASVLAAAEAHAAAQHKAIFLTFSASWCAWCHELDAYVGEPAVQTILDKYFVFADVHVEENGKTVQDSPGGLPLMLSFGDNNTGLPYFAFLSAAGKPLVTSKDIGYPVKPEEVAWFIKMLHVAAPSMPNSELQSLRQALLAHNRNLR